MAFTTTRLVEFSDTDMAGIMHFASFFRYMESVEHELLRGWGFSIFDSSADVAISFPRVGASCEFHAPVRSEDVMDITVTVERVGDKSVTYGFDFRRGETRIASGKMTAVCCRIRPGKPPESTAIPDELAARLRAAMAGG